MARVCLAPALPSTPIIGPIIVRGRPHRVPWHSPRRIALRGDREGRVIRFLRALFANDPLTAFRARMAFIVGYAVIAAGLILWIRCTR